jgi:hypothetical protein
MGERPGGSRSNVLVLASLTLSVISLFVAISGAATAGKTSLPANSVGSKQLKPEAVKTTDVAPAAIGSQALQPRAVTVPAIAPNAVTAPAIAPSAVATTNIAPGAVTAPTIANGAVGGAKISDGAVTKPKIGSGAVGTGNIEPGAVTGPKIGPRAVSTPALSIPEATVEAAGLTTNNDMGNCQGFFPAVSFTAVRSDPPSMFNVSNPTDLVAPVDGVYSLTLGMEWSHSDGYVRGAFVSRFNGGGLELVGIPGEAPGPVGYAQTIDGGNYELQAGDALRVFPVACADGMTPATAPTLNDIRASLKWVAQPAG